jgi:hypothetical protein
LKIMWFLAQGCRARAALSTCPPTRIDAGSLASGTEGLQRISGWRHIGRVRHMQRMSFSSTKTIRQPWIAGPRILKRN